MARSPAVDHRPPENILGAMADPAWWGDWFKTGDWRGWRAFLAAVFGLPLPEDTLDLFRACTGLTDAPGARAAEVFAIIGRRGGKTKILSLIAAWLAAFVDWSPFLSRGEKAHILLVAKDRTQATIAFGFISSFFLDHPVLKRMVKAEAADQLELANGVVIRVAAASFRGLRGYAIAALLADELAFWFDGETSANPAEEILRAVKPAMLQFQGRAMLLAGSSPFKRSGPLWDAFRDHYGKPGPTLVWLAPTETMHRLTPEQLAEIERERDRDPEGVAAEYDCVWRDDIAAFLDQALIDQAIDPGVTLRPPKPDIAYGMVIDPAGGRGDSFAATIGHVEDGKIIQDFLYEKRAPFFPSEVIAELEPWAKRYRIVRVMSDRYAEAVFADALRSIGLMLEVKEANTSDTYMQALPRFADGVVRLLDDRRQANQLVALQRRTSGSGKDTVTHPRNMHDDCAAVFCGLVVLLADAAVPSFGRREALVADDRLVEMPEWCRGLVAVLALNPARSMAAIAFFAERASYAMGPRGRASGTAADPAQATLVDVLELPLVDIADRLRRRLEELADIVRPLDGFGCIVPAECVSSFHMDNIGCEAWPAEWLHEPSSLTMPLSGYISRGEFRIARPAVERGLPLGGALALRAGEKIGDDALQLAILVGLRQILMWTAAEDFPIDAAAITGG